MKHLKLAMVALFLFFSGRVQADCSGICTWFTTVFQNADDVIEYVLVEGQELFADVVRSTITSLEQMYKEDPDAFQKFISLCFENSGSPIPAEILDWLKKFNLVQSDATISDVVKLVVGLVVHRENGAIKISSFDDFVKNKNVRVKKVRIE
jgi:hypothetical protein